MIVAKLINGNAQFALTNKKLMSHEIATFATDTVKVPSYHCERIHIG